MVLNMNFGGGDYDERTNKTRKEVFEEIIAKSKAYKVARYEVKEAGKELTSRLDDQFFDILPLLNMSKVKDPATSVAPQIDTYELLTSKMKEQ